MSYIFLAVFPAALIIAAANDIYEFKIPNWISLVLCLSFPFCLLLSGGNLQLLWEGYLIGAVLLVIGFIFFAFKIIGGGDAKLLASASIWVGQEAVLEYLIVTALAGGGLSLLLLTFRGFPMLPFYARVSWLMELYQTKKGIPYGVAIAIGGIQAFPSTEIFTLIF